MSYMITTRLAGLVRTVARDDDAAQGWKTCCRSIAAADHRNVFDTREEAEAAAALFRAACAGVTTDVVET
jgi:hypothetical protein